MHRQLSSEHVHTMCRFHGAQAQRVQSDKHLAIKTPTEATHNIQFSLVSNSWVSNAEFERFHDLRAQYKLEQISKREVCGACSCVAVFHAPLLRFCYVSSAVFHYSSTASAYMHVSQWCCSMHSRCWGHE